MYSVLGRRSHKKHRPGNPRQASTGRLIVGQIHKTITHYFPDLFDRMERFAEPRKRRDYSMSELVTAAIAMFLFHRGSRNQMNLSRQEQKFRRNYQRLFKMRLPHMDTVDELLRVLDEAELERLKATLIRTLIEKKVLNRLRLGRRYVISIDATHVGTYEENYCGECVYRTVGKKGKKLWFHSVLEAKLVPSTGLSLSIASEWIANPGSEYDKQDCELKAFARLATKIKSYFPRLPICIVGDGLYPNSTVFNICWENGWDFIITFQDGNLPSVWEEVNLLGSNPHREQVHKRYGKNCETVETFRWLNGIEYGKGKLNWIEAGIEKTDLKTGEVKKNRFVHLSSMEIDPEQAKTISDAGRMRWKIENEGFNAQKNHGYELGHKYSESSFPALKNYYQCLQIAHIINQLTQKSTTVSGWLKANNKLTIKFLWEKLISFMDEGNLENMQKRRCQIRLAG